MHFVEKYNSENSETYKRTRFLDVEDLSNKQPEVLCTNESDDTLVIERKSLLWPLNYAQLHVAEHKLWELLFQKFKGKREGNYTIHAGPINKVSDSSLESLANEVVAHSLPAASGLRPGHGISIPVSTDISIRREYSNERDLDEPQTVLRILSSEISCDDLKYPICAPSGFIGSIRIMLRSASDKMSQHIDSRKVLILNYSSGTMFWTCDAEWWRSYLAANETPPYSFDELWLSFNYKVENRAFEKAWS